MTETDDLRNGKHIRHGHRDPINQSIRSRNNNRNDTSSHSQLPTHPSLDGFELHNQQNRDGKMAPEFISVSTTKSTSEVITVGTRHSYANDAQEQKPPRILHERTAN